jgi:hypothetical protein
VRGAWPRREAESERVAIERFGVRRGFKRQQLIRREDGFIHLAGVDAFADELYRVAHRDANDDLNRFWKNRSVQNFIWLQVFGFHPESAFKLSVVHT